MIDNPIEMARKFDPVKRSKRPQIKSHDSAKQTLDDRRKECEAAEKDSRGKKKEQISLLGCKDHANALRDAEATMAAAEEEVKKKHDFLNDAERELNRKTSLFTDAENADHEAKGKSTAVGHESDRQHGLFTSVKLDLKKGRMTMMLLQELRMSWMPVRQLLKNE
jgi:hypothetical protein